jgi:hypothetical protein
MTAVKDSSAMLTAREVRAIIGVPVAALHDWAANRKRGIAASASYHLRVSICGCRVTRRLQAQEDIPGRRAP